MNRIKEQAIFLAQLFLRDFSRPEKLQLFLRVMPYTMVGYKRLSNVHQLAERAQKDGLQGAFVECGVWKGGAAGVMGYMAEKESRSRPVWLFDSFEGLPEPSGKDGELAKVYAAGKDSGQLSSIGQCVGPLEDVKKLFLSVLRLKGDNVHIEKGWFQDTLPRARERVGGIAILRLDGDWYESTKVTLENLYDNVVQGGYVIIDDYGHWEGCKRAVDEFLRDRGIKVDLKKIDYTGVYFQK